MPQDEIMYFMIKWGPKHEEGIINMTRDLRKIMNLYAELALECGEIPENEVPEYLK